jgi:hypothetical protein
MALECAFEVMGPLQSTLELVSGDLIAAWNRCRRALSPSR